MRPIQKPVATFCLIALTIVSSTPLLRAQTDQITAPSASSRLPQAVLRDAPQQVGDSAAVVPQRYTPSSVQLEGPPHSNAFSPVDQDVRTAQWSSTTDPTMPQIGLVSTNAAIHSVDSNIEREANTVAEGHIPLKPSGQSESRHSVPSGRSTWQILLSVGSSLSIVIGLFLGVAIMYRKTLQTGFQGLPKTVVQVLGRTPLASRQQLVLVRFGSKLVLVSLVQGEARAISEITDPLEVDQLAGQCESVQPGSISSSFRNILLNPGNN
ncbi:MAG: flagellar biosynthetic protein FliO [Planctomycetales bacterium]|nr:flagellar biosynthetic protein FliO [Planctomycetales bacterium]